MKIRNRILYLLIAAFVIYAGIFSAFIYYSISNYAFTDFYKRLEIRAAIAAKIKIDKPSDINSIKEVGQEYLENLPNQRDYIFPVKDNVLVEDSLMTKIPKGLIAEVLNQSVGNEHIKEDFYTGILHKNIHNEKFVVIVTAQNYFYNHHISYLKNLLIVCFIVGILWIVFFALLISESIIKPVKKIVQEVLNISTENLHLRLEEPSENDALTDIRHTFNDMLDRLETSFETQKNFISNASHELNTPLTSIIGEADLVLSKERKPERYQKAIQKMLSEAEKLSSKTKALLFLARTGFDGKIQKFSEIRIDQLVLDVKETLQEMNGDSRVSIDFSMLPEEPELLTIYGNEQLLHLALSNVLMNACKYSSNAQVYLSLGFAKNEVSINVKDSGIGIPEQEISHIYDPYFRASNTADFEGYGIGLPLSRNIVKIHHGTLKVSSDINKGTNVELKFPIAGSESSNDILI